MLTQPSRIVKTQKAPMFAREHFMASETKQVSRLVICVACDKNVGGVCRQCCSGVPVKVLVRLEASRCRRNYW